jgi:hypothetical protein
LSTILPEDGKRTDPEISLLYICAFRTLFDARSLKQKPSEIRKSVGMPGATLVASSVSTEYLDTVKTNASGTFQCKADQCRTDSRSQTLYFRLEMR